jgi:hypothetical protein
MQGWEFVVVIRVVQFDSTNLNNNHNILVYDTIWKTVVNSVVYRLNSTLV